LDYERTPTPDTSVVTRNPAFYTPEIPNLSRSCWASYRQPNLEVCSEEASLPTIIPSQSRASLLPHVMPPLTQMVKRKTTCYGTSTKKLGCYNLGVYWRTGGMRCKPQGSPKLTRRMVIPCKGSSTQQRTCHKHGLGRRLFGGLVLRLVALSVHPEMSKLFRTRSLEQGLRTACPAAGSTAHRCYSLYPPL